MATRKKTPRPRRAARHRRARVVRFKMKSAKVAIAPTVDRVLDAVRSVGLTTEQRENLAVAVAEALSNAAVHGNRLEPRKWVSIKVTATPARAVVDVADSGSGFNLGTIKDPTEPSRVLVSGGRGVFLMRRLVDHLEYNRAGNRVRLTMDARPRKM